MKSSLLNWVLLSAISASAFGQGKTITAPASPPSHSSSTPKDATIDYSGEPIVVERFDVIYQMATDGTGFKQSTMAIRVQSEAALKQFGVLTIPYAGNSERIEIAYARVRHPDGTVVETTVTDAFDMPEPVTREAPFYSDLKQKQLPIRNLGVGDTLEWQAKVIRIKSEIPGQFWGQENFFEDVVTLSESLELRIPANVMVNVWSPSSKPQETSTNAEHIFRWVTSQKKQTVGKAADAEKELKKKQIWTTNQELDEEQGKLPTVAWSTFKTWEEVGAWYRSLEVDKTIPTPEIKAKVAELTAGKTTDEEKVRAVYAYVATQIRYIGVAFGIGRYQPHLATEVMQNQYGDCKDKHTLLAAMINALGLHADAVLIGAGIRFNEVVPSPASFNHLITLVHVDGQPVWLDATAEVAPYRMLMYIIRDRSALVIPDTGAAQIERTPANLPFASYQKLDAVGTLDKEGTSNSHLVWQFRGDDELALRAVLRQTSPAQYDQLVQQMSHGIGYSGTTSHPEVSKLNDTAEPLKLVYDYTREKNGDWDNYRIISQLAPVNLYKPDEKDPPVRSIVLGIPHVETSTAAMKIPDGWGVELPEAIHARSIYATFDQTYRFEKGTLYSERRVEILQRKVPVSDWKTYKKWTDDANIGNEQYVQLTNISDSSTPSNTSNSEAAKLVATAYKAVQQHHLDEVEPLLEQAKKLNPEQIWLWTTYGYLAYEQRRWYDAIECYRQELAYHSEQYGTYGSMAQAQINSGKRGDAKDTLRKWASVDQSNPVPSTKLIALLIADNDAQAALSAAHVALIRLPDDKKKDEHLQLQIGRAQMLAGEKEQGTATFLALMQSTQVPLMMNNAAYELADANVELPAAETTTRAALTKMEEESQTWTLNEDLQTLLSKSSYIADTWDTMGWILYREKKFDEAEQYVRAAWNYSFAADRAEHLGDILLAKGDKTKAFAAYLEGMAVITHRPDVPGQTQPSAEQTRIGAKVDKLSKAGIPNTAKTLQELRTFSLGSAIGLDGVAEYSLMISEAKTKLAKPTGAKDLKNGSERLKTLQLSHDWPPSSHANLVRKAMLNCHSGICEVVFE